MHAEIVRKWNSKVNNGDTHNSPEDDYFQKCLAGMKDNDCRHIGDSPIRACNVGCMKPWMDYEPRSLQEILKES